MCLKRRTPPKPKPSSTTALIALDWPDVIVQNTSSKGPFFLSPNQVHKLEHEGFQFTFVRNLYSGVFPAYLGKVGRRKHQALRFLA